MLTKKPFGDIITFTRGSAGGRFNAQGVYEMVPADTPRIDYDPVTGECKGLLIEEQRTNLCTNSVPLYGWSSATGELTSDNFHGAQFYKAIKQNSTSSESRLIALGPATAGITYTYTLALMAGSANSASIGLHGEAAGWGSNADSTARILRGPGVLTQNAGGLWSINSLSAISPTLVSITRKFTVNGTLVLTVYPDSYSSVIPGESVKFTRVQLEVGSFPTSYIHTSGSQVTRAADVVSINTLSPWFNASEGCFYVDVSSEWGNDNRDHQILGIVGGAHGVQGIARFSGGSLQIHDGTSYRVLPNPLFNTPGSRKVAVSYRNGETASPAAINGIDRNYTSDGSVFDAATAIGLGRTASGSNAWGGHIRKLRYFPKRLDNATLQALTA